MSRLYSSICHLETDIPVSPRNWVSLLHRVNSWNSQLSRRSRSNQWNNHKLSPTGKSASMRRWSFGILFISKRFTVFFLCKRNYRLFQSSLFTIPQFPPPIRRQKARAQWAVPPLPTSTPAVYSFQCRARFWKSDATLYHRVSSSCSCSTSSRSSYSSPRCEL
jgi:hypothetical protein